MLADIVKDQDQALATRPSGTGARRAQLPPCEPSIHPSAAPGLLTTETLIRKVGFGSRRMSNRNKGFLLATLALALLLVACAERRTIADLQRDPGRFYNREVAISGRVVNSFGILGSGAYQVDDGTGRMWVISEGYGIPSRDAFVEVVGSLQETATISGRNFSTVLRETHRRRGANY